MTTITIGAVGDLLMKNRIIDSARISKNNQYSFGPIFAGVARHLKNNDLLIGNLETTFSGTPWFGSNPNRLGRYERRSKRTGYPMFNCPDELASTLKHTGFDVMTTANNHCADGGEYGIKRTLNVLDRHGLKHTGTARSLNEAKRLLIMRVKGIDIGILSYTYGTNRMPVAKSYQVNRLHSKKIAADINRIKKKCDFVIVCLHFGREFHLKQNKAQKRLVDLCFRHGANAILGAHPHVLQPVVTRKVKDKYGVTKTRVAAYSLGNFLSSKLFNNIETIRAMILKLTITKNSKGSTDIKSVSRIRTVTKYSKPGGKPTYRLVPVTRRR
ncbi:CapA family protein [Candidatus Pristimantibacillus sp. PTI5]|uniref:CapA family protein n=1 Tax=Candidatus Pristimantibacillus sp. PTI5 TaxID=3400422 RepID=UPI003B0164BA